MVQSAALVALMYPATQVQSIALFDSVNRVVENCGQGVQILLPVPEEYFPFMHMSQEFAPSFSANHPASHNTQLRPVNDADPATQ